MALTNPNKSQSMMADKNSNPLLGDAQSVEVEVIDALDGATLTGDTLTTSATPTVTELEANDGVLGGKINKILQVLAAHGLMKDA